MKDRALILASASPRRREILAKWGYTFTVLTPDVDESADGLPCEMVRVLSERKARAAAETVQKGLIIAADTLVAADDRALGKPRDAEQAREMLLSLSGRAHDVFSGLCLLNAESGDLRAHVERTRVHFRALTDEEIDQYIRTGEPMDKAGAYAIQGGAGRFVTAIEGSYENVMGFPIQAFERMLAEFP